MAYFVLAKVIEKSKDVFSIEEYKTNEQIEIKIDKVGKDVNENEYYLFELKSENCPVLNDWMTLKDMQDKNIITLDDLATYGKALTNLDEIEELLEYHWDSSSQSKVTACLKELRKNKVEVTEIEQRFEQLLEQKERVQLEEKKRIIKDVLKGLEKEVREQRWDDSLVEIYQKELQIFKSKGGQANELERAFRQLEQENYHNEKEKEMYGIKEVTEGAIESIFTEKQLVALSSIEYRLKGIVIGYEDWINEENESIMKKLDEGSKNKTRQMLLEAKLDSPSNYGRFCLEIVKRAPNAITLLDSPTEESKILAVDKNIKLFPYIENKSEKLCLHALKKDGTLLKHIDRQTPEMCMVALETSPESVAYFKI